MKKSLMLLATMLFTFGIIFIGCEADEEEVHVLVGDWSMSNLEQSSFYYAANNDLAAYGISEGTFLGAGTKTWADFTELGVNATVALYDDFTFNLSGTFPQANDTLGFPLSKLQLNDAGTWTAAEDLSTLLIDGSIYDIGGAMTLDSETDPTVITLVYSDVEIDTVVLPLDTSIPPDGIPDFFIPGVAVKDSSNTTLGFTKQ